MPPIFKVTSVRLLKNDATSGRTADRSFGRHGSCYIGRKPSLKRALARNPQEMTYLSGVGFIFNLLVSFWRWKFKWRSTAGR